MQANPSDLVTLTGRPLLVVPDTSSWLDLRSVLIAWKDTPEARRAIADALPMVRQAKDINVVEILEDDVNRPAALSGVNDVVAWLSRHGLVASGQVPRRMRRCRQATGKDRVAGRRRPRRCGRLRSFAASRMGSRWCDETSRQSVESVFAIVALNLSGIDLDQNHFCGSVVE
jgi:hypothetical protein